MSICQCRPADEHDPDTAENRLHKMANDERQYQQKITSIRQERAGMKNELAELMGGIEL